ncbi:MAG: DUF4174 domain-containing protein [Planctomycetota bacterium]
MPSEISNHLTATASLTAVVIGLGCEQPRPTLDRTPIAPNVVPVVQANTTLVELNMYDFAWSNRPLLVFADGPDRQALVEQRDELAGYRDALAKRDMVVVEILGESITVDGKPYLADVEDLKKRYGVAADAGFAVRLVGKDTGVKLRRDRPVAVEELLALIDAMPMRRQEIRDRSR